MEVIKDSQGKFDYEKMREGFSAYIVRPANVFGIGGFVFDVEGETVQTTESEITNHFVEDNSAIQDHIAIRPLTIELNGFVGELVDIRDEGVKTDIQKAFQKLVTIESYLPPLASAATRFKEVASDVEIRSFDDLVDTGGDLYSLAKNANPTASKQQLAYLYFKTVQEKRILLSLETPFEFLQNMAVESVIATQAEDTKAVSSFSIIMKQIRTSSFKTVALDVDTAQKKSEQQKASVVDKGKNQGVEKSILASSADASLEALKQVFGAF